MAAGVSQGGRERKRESMVGVGEIERGGVGMGGVGAGELTMASGGRVQDEGASFEVLGGWRKKKINRMSLRVRYCEDGNAVNHIVFSCLLEYDRQAKISALFCKRNVEITRIRQRIVYWNQEGEYRVLHLRVT